MKRKGFTLIELLVVISVIALLMAILVPVLQKAKYHARLVICGSNQHQIVAGLATYANNNNDLLPPTPVSIQTNPEAAGNYHRPTELNWYDNQTVIWDEETARKKPNYRFVGRYLYKYLPEAEVFSCPVVMKIDNEAPWPPNDPKGTYGEYYETGECTFLHSTYTLLWNYQGYNAAIKANKKRDASTDESFVGPRKLGSKNQVVLLDSCFYGENKVTNIHTEFQESGYYSAHPFKDAYRDWAYYVMPKEQYIHGDKGTKGKSRQDRQFRPKVKLNAGYLDGHVSRYNMQESRRVRNWNISIFLPEEWK